MSVVESSPPAPPIGHARIDGVEKKVRGTAPYAYEHLTDAVYLWPITATVARGRVTSMDTAAAESTDGVVAVLTIDNAPRLADTSDGDLTILQSPEIAYRGQLIGAVIAESPPEIAREAAASVSVSYDEAPPHDTEFRVDHPNRYRPPEKVNGGFETTSETGEPDRILDDPPAGTVVVDEWYSTPEEHNNPMEPHTVVATWEPDEETLTLYDSTQSTQGVVSSLAPVLGLEPAQMRVIAPHMSGGGFGSKGSPHSHDVLAVMAAMRVPGRAVKFAVSRQHMFAYVAIARRRDPDCASPPAPTATSRH